MSDKTTAYRIGRKLWQMNEVRCGRHGPHQDFADLPPRVQAEWRGKAQLVLIEAYGPTDGMLTVAHENLGLSRVAALLCFNDMIKAAWAEGAAQ